MVYVQGNKETSDEYVAKGLQMASDNIKEFCEGGYTIIS